MAESNSRLKAHNDDVRSAQPENLDSLPRLRGFRLRGTEMTRLETFVDAAFAFAITMLIIVAQQIPEDIGSLLGAFRNVPTFITSIAALGTFWWGHWIWSRRYGLEDGISTLISWALITTVLIYIYPLKAIFGAMWYEMSGGYLGQAVPLQATAKQGRALFSAYGLGFVAICGEILLLNFRAWRLRESLRLSADEKLMTRAAVTGWSIPMITGLLSVVLARSLPVRWIDWAGWTYFSMPITTLLHNRWYARKIRGQ